MSRPSGVTRTTSQDATGLWSGDGATANIYIGAAQAEEPYYRLAGLLRNAFDVGLPPGWARRR